VTAADPRVYTGPLPTGVHQITDELGHVWIVDTVTGLLSCDERRHYDASFADVCRTYRVPAEQFAR
jgi:hypothetical protein